MRFDKVARYEYTPTARKTAAILRKQQRDRDKYPLFADMVAAEQKPPDEVHALRASAAVRSGIEQRAYLAVHWRRARREIAALPPAERDMILRRWNLSRFWPGTGLYLISMLHMHREGRLQEPSPNCLYPDRATRNASEAARLAMLNQHHPGQGAVACAG